MHQTKDGLSITITKASIHKEVFLKVEYIISTKDGISKVSQECTARIHEDLKAAFGQLDTHLATICEQYDDTGKRVDGLVACTAFVVSGKADKEGVVLIGSRALPSGKAMSLASPHTMWAPEGEDAYVNIEQLAELIEVCRTECFDYLFNGKHAPVPVQGVLFNGNEEGEEGTEEPGELDANLPAGRDGQEPMSNFYRDPNAEAPAGKKKRRSKKEKAQDEEEEI